MQFEQRECNTELVIVGAGLAGFCAAIQAARAGVKVALINDGGVIGGNASGEIGVFINGASDGGQLNINAREGGIISEILTEYKYRSPARTNPIIVDTVYLDMVHKEENIELFLNTCIDSIGMKEGKIVSVTGSQNTTERRWTFTGKWIVDSTGDGALGAMAGAEFMIGREAKSTFNESIAEDKADHYVLPSTLSFNTHDVGFKVPFVGPDFAYDIPSTGILDRRDVKGFSTKWYFEIGGEYDHVKDREAIIMDHKKLVFGVWDYLKNSGDFPECDNYDFDSISTIPGTREYRRLKGDYILTENDIRDQTDFEDTVAHGGWNIDLHAIKGIFDDDMINRHINFDGIYKIPYRVCYSKNISNLFMSGRCMSTSHVAFGSTRVMSTLATVGQAVGMAASLCKKYGVMPRGVYLNHIEELQQNLIKADQYIPGLMNQEESDLARSAEITTSSTATYESTMIKSLNIEDKINNMTPQFRGYYKKMYERINSTVALDNPLGIMIPVSNQLDTLSIKIKNIKVTKLKYQVYLPKKPENYGPDTLIFDSEIDLSIHDSYEWVDLPIGLMESNRYALVVFNRNEDVALACGGHSLPTTVSLTGCKNTNPRNIDLKTLEMAGDIWLRNYLTPCFKTSPVQKVYEASNINNGYNRAYGQPNMWLSDRGENHRVRIKWNESRIISQLHITYAPDTTKRFYHELNTQVYDLIGVDYDVYAIVDGKEVLITKVRDNHHKLNHLIFDPVRADQIIIKYSKTTSNQLGINEIRVY